MKLLRLRTKNLRGLPDAVFSFRADLHPQVVTGPGGSGKSSLLRAIAAARRAVEPHECPPSADALLAHGKTEGELHSWWSYEGQTFEVPFRLGQEGRPAIPPALHALLGRAAEAGNGFEWIPAGRMLDARSTLGVSPTSDAAERLKRYTEAPDKYQALWGALHAEVSEAASSVLRVVQEGGVVFRSQLPDGLERYRRAVARMCPTLRLTSVEPRERLRPLVWFQKVDGARIEASDLSDGERQGFLCACAFTWLGLDQAVVLVDTPELHLHPSEHLRFFRALCELGTRSQIIAVTTSPTILDSVGRENIIDLSKVEGRE